MGQSKSLAVQKGIRFPKWMDDAIEEIAKKGGFTFTDVVLDLIRQELNSMGYSMGIGREANLLAEAFGVTADSKKATWIDAISKKEKSASKRKTG